MLDRRDILENLADPETYPAEMLAYCLKNPDRSAAIFLPILGKAANGTELDALEAQSFYLGLHILAVLRTQNTFDGVYRLATRQPLILADLLGEVGLGETFPRVLMCLGYGKATDLWEGFQNDKLDFMIRDAFLRAWTYEALKGRVNAVSTERNLRGFLKSEDAPPADDPIWSGWLIAIADLGYSELTSVARDAVASGRILAEDENLAAREFEGFETALDEAQSDTDLPEFLAARGYIPFGEGDGDWGNCFINSPQSHKLR
ncbi:hypothetical protein J7444_02125 [Labrenzia sp. R4_1]|uniref:hypothetical protein n=1 Tax=Labrenzia sp. R4_1 TaxID=2821106 RepID=UPI001AD9835E|nr:hypothetical protein [Labrenzia sp. R4_1]MBO9423494.1 hypothetical protein [Labrenzia sp. R4_1]